MTATVALLRTPPTAFKPVDVPTALRQFASNTRRREEAPAEVLAILKWVERNAMSMAVWEDTVDPQVDIVPSSLGACRVSGTTGRVTLRCGGACRGT